MGRMLSESHLPEKSKAHLAREKKVERKKGAGFVIVGKNAILPFVDT